MGKPKIKSQPLGAGLAAMAAMAKRASAQGAKLAKKIRAQTGRKNNYSPRKSKRSYPVYPSATGRIILGRSPLLIVDGHNLAHQASHEKGRVDDPHAVAEGTLTLLHRGIVLIRPASVIVTWDSGLDTARTVIYKDYKCSRRKMKEEETEGDKQRRQMREKDIAFLRTKVLAPLGVWQILGLGQPTEGDDLMYVAGRTAQTDGRHTSVVYLSSDTDLYQLLTPQGPGEGPTTPAYSISPRDLFHPGKLDALRDGTYVRDRYGYWPRDAVFAKALVGDNSDSIPGVKGVGAKTVKELFERYGSSAAVMKDLAKLQGRAAALASREGLMVLRRNVRLIRLRHPSHTPTILPAMCFPGLEGEMARSRALGVMQGEHVQPWGDKDPIWWFRDFAEMTERGAIFNK